MECVQKDISKKTCTIFPPSVQNTDDHPVDKSVGTSDGLAMGTITRRLPPEYQQGDTPSLQITRTSGNRIHPYTLKTCNTYGKFYFYSRWDRMPKTKKKRLSAIGCYQRNRMNNHQEQMIYENRNCHKSQMSKDEAKTLFECSKRHGKKWYTDPIGTQYLAGESVSVSNRISPEYSHLGRCTCVCRHCGAMFLEKECERLASASRTSLSLVSTMFAMVDEDAAASPEFKVSSYNLLEHAIMSFPQLLKRWWQIGFWSRTAIKKIRNWLNITSQLTKADKRMSMNMYYSYQIHDRLNHYSLLLHGGKLFQQKSALYVYSIIFDAHAICPHGSPSFFITFTCNTKWPEIEEFMKPYPQLTVADRADIIDRVFEKKVRDYIDFVRDSNTFGSVTGESKKRAFHTALITMDKAINQNAEDVE
ncbi:DNA helicase [Tanacetum coccineum]